jgi:hypothetical protein
MISTDSNDTMATLDVTSFSTVESNNTTMFHHVTTLPSLQSKIYRDYRVSDDQSNSMSAGQIVGVVIGVLASLCCIFICCVILCDSSEESSKSGSSSIKLRSKGHWETRIGRVWVPEI